MGLDTSGSVVRRALETGPAVNAWVELLAEIVVAEVLREEAAGAADRACVAIQVPDQRSAEDF